MADLVPWNTVEADYAAGFVNNGAPAHPARMAFGTLIAKQILGVSDEELVCQVAENAYLQYFIGLKEFSEDCPFGASTLVAFRKRFTENDIARINEIMLENAKKDHDDHDDSPAGGESTMALDATVAPSDITYPQDVKLLNAARERLEGIIDDICIQTGSPKPRTYRQLARKDFLNWSKSKRRSAKKVRVAISRQLGYIRRDLRYIQTLTEALEPDMTARQVQLLETITALYDQQSCMHRQRTHSVQNRIVSISQPWVRPVVRGKANANTEFGAKVHISTDDGGYVRVERMSFDVFNESEDLVDAVESYRNRTGCYPDRLLADQIYRNRSNYAWCKDRGIRLSGPKLGRPPKDTEVTRLEKKTERQDAADRNVVEGVFGTAKTAYGAGRVAARLQETTKTVISMAFLVLNLKKTLGASLTDILEALIVGIKSITRVPIGNRWWSSWNYRPVTEWPLNTYVKQKAAEITAKVQKFICTTSKKIKTAWDSFASRSDTVSSFATHSVDTTKSSITAKGPNFLDSVSHGLFRGKVSGAFGFVEGMFRGQFNKVIPGEDPNNTLIGGYGKASIFNLDVQRGLGSDKFSVSQRDVIDIGTVTAQAGAQYQSGLGLGANARASVATVRETIMIDVSGWQVEVGGYANGLTAGAGAAAGKLPDGGWGVDADYGAGWYGLGIIVRVKPQ